MAANKKITIRWYVVTNKEDGARCLVEASSRTQAFRRSAEHYCTAEPATAADAIEMTRAECDVISAPTVPQQMDMDEVISGPVLEFVGTFTKPEHVPGENSSPPGKEGTSPAAPGPGPLINAAEAFKSFDDDWSKP